MTEKRFTHKKWYNERQLFDGDEPFAIVDVYIQAEVICDKLNDFHEENQLLKQALRELLEEEGNAYAIELLDEIFDLKYREWQNKMNDTETYDYVDWEEILEQKKG